MQWGALPRASRQNEPVNAALTPHVGGSVQRSKPVKDEDLSAAKDEPYKVGSQGVAETRPSN